MQITPNGRPNQYTDLWVPYLPSDYESVLFSQRRAVLGRLDVVHLHWPEHFAHLVHKKGWRRYASIAMRLAFLARLRWGGVRLVRTMHNLAAHEPIESRWTRWYVAQLEKATRGWIVINGQTPTPDPARTVLIPHPHYRRLYPQTSSLPTPASGRLLYFGLIRRYKNVPRLIESLRAARRPDLQLDVVGEPSPAALADEVRAAAGGDPSIRLALGYAADADLAAALAASEMVVLPYTRMHNSGALMLALSLDRQVIAPRGPVVEELRAEIGDAWIVPYDGDLDASVLMAAVETARAHRSDARPDLHRRDPVVAARATADFYDRVLRG